MPVVGGFQEGLDADTALHINAVGEASLEHIVGGPESLWARPFFSRSEESSSGDGDDDDNNDYGNGDGNDPGVQAAAAAAAAASEVGGEGHQGGELSVPLMLLAARLQGAVAMGRGPAVARALTSTVPPFGGEWMLPRARPVQVTRGRC